MREHLEHSVLAGRLGLTSDELDALIDRLRIRVVESERARFLRVRDAALIVKAVDKPASAMWRSEAAWTRPLR